LPGNQATQNNAKVLAIHSRGGRTVDFTDHRAGQSIWPVWISPDNSHAETGRMEGESQAGRKDLEE
jgi:hypothetical protein